MIDYTFILSKLGGLFYIKTKEENIQRRIKVASGIDGCHDGRGRRKMFKEMTDVEKLQAEN